MLDISNNMKNTIGSEVCSLISGKCAFKRVSKNAVMLIMAAFTMIDIIPFIFISGIQLLITPLLWMESTATPCKERMVNTAMNHTHARVVTTICLFLLFKVTRFKPNRDLYRDACICLQNLLMWQNDKMLQGHRLSCFRKKSLPAHDLRK